MIHGFIQLCIIFRIYFRSRGYLLIRLYICMYMMRLMMLLRSVDDKVLMEMSGSNSPTPKKIMLPHTPLSRGPSASSTPNRYTVLYCTVLYCTVLYCTVLYCTVLYCTVLYCTVLYCASSATYGYLSTLYCRGSWKILISRLFKDCKIYKIAMLLNLTSGLLTNAQLDKV